MSQWSASKARLRLGWQIKRQRGSHRTLTRPDWPDYVFAFQDDDEIAHGCWHGSRSTRDFNAKICDKPMQISSRTPEGTPNRCPICGATPRIEPSKPAGDAPCPQCGALLWFNGATSSARRRAKAKWPFVLGTVAAAAASVIAAFFVGWNGMLGLGPTEFTALIVLAVLLFGRTLPTLGRFLGELLVRKTSR
jgi:predicted RNA binding protein YcfA (HicA-like mRNA interferase family)